MLINTELRKISLKCPVDDTSASRVNIEIKDDDRLLRGDSWIFSKELASMGLVLAMSAVSQDLLTENLSTLGYDEISTLAFDNDLKERAGMCIASKKLADTTAVAVIIRGTRGREWYSNFDIGYGTDHHGFSTAADYAELRLGDYIFTRMLGERLSFFITGYSRGGAVANILAKRLSERYGIDSVRAYTFASPHTTISPRAGRYGSIFNLVRDEDFFTRVPLSGWGYHKYGRTVSLIGNIGERFGELTHHSYIGFTSSQEVEDFLGAAICLAPNIRAYYERRYPVGDRLLSLYEYMLSVADLLADNTDESTGDIMMSSVVSDFADMTAFLASGMDINALLSPASGTPRCSVADSHSIAAYIAAMEAYFG